MNKIEIAVMCPCCGKWKGLTTTNLKEAQLSCFDCGKAVKIRNSNGWNVNYHLPKENQEISLLVSLLNMRDKDL